jgi:hypothetical protein
MLTPIAEGVWGYERDLKMPGGIRLPSRSTLVRLRSGGLLVHSPLRFDDETAAAIDARGPVEVLVAPSCVHWLFLEAATKRWPSAQVLGAPGLERKLGRVSFAPLPSAGALPGLGDEIAVRRIEGAPYMGEHVFLHRPSGSLVVTDLLFNVHQCTFGLQVFMRLAGTYQKTAQSRIWRLLTKDRSAAAESAEAVLAWDFRRVVVAHGDVVEEDAHARTRTALAPMLSGGGGPRQKLLDAA